MTRVLAYAVDLETVKAVEIGFDTVMEHRLAPALPMLDDVDALVGELNTPALIARPHWSELERFAAGWGRSLLPSAWLADPPESCVLVPHGYLHALPLHLVRTDSGRPLCVDSALSYSSSLTALRFAMQRSVWSQDVADPFIPVRRQSRERLHRRNPFAKEHGTTDFAYLPPPGRHLAAGVDALGSSDDAWRALPAKLLQAFTSDATASEIIDEPLRDLLVERLIGKEYELVVLAAHGHRNALDALDGGLVLGAPHEPRRRELSGVFGRIRDETGLLYSFPDLPVRDLPPMLDSGSAELLSVAELEQRRAYLVCPLVVLLGCSTGRPVIHAGDQPQSLSEMFLRIGAACVLAPMWDVRLPVAREWTTEFLRALRRRTDRGRAAAAQSASRILWDAGAALQDVGCMQVHGDYR